MLTRVVLLALVAACNANHAAAPDAAVDAPPPACMYTGGPSRVIIADDVPGLIAGRWQLCGGAAEFSSVEFTLDQHFYLLKMQDGSWVRTGDTGTYTVDPSSRGTTFSIMTASVGYALHGDVVEQQPRWLGLGGGDYTALP